MPFFTKKRDIHLFHLIAKVSNITVPVCRRLTTGRKPRVGYTFTLLIEFGATGATGFSVMNNACNALDNYFHELNCSFKNT